MIKNNCEIIYKNIFPFWEQMSDNDRDMLLQFSTEAIYEKGENLHGGDGECTGVIIVKSGCIRTYILSDNGREITLYRLYPGDICTLSASCIIDAISFDVFIDAEKDSECLVINGNAFSEITERSLLIKNYILEITVSRFSDVMWAMQQILFMSFDKRLAIFLLDELSKTGDVYIKLTHEQIAKYMGSAREVVSRMLKYFSTEGIIESSRGEIKILDKAKLRKLAL